MRAKIRNEVETLTKSVSMNQLLLSVIGEYRPVRHQERASLWLLSL
jgi:hypothetical protein